MGEYLPLQLEQKEQLEHARTLLARSQPDGGMFVQAWVSAAATK